MNYLGFNTDKITKTGESLNQLLSNYHIYYQNLRTFHWNITGQHFFDLHVQFEELYNDARMKIDEIAERLLTLRLTPISEYSDYIEKADIKESKEWIDSLDMVHSLLEDHRLLIKNMREVLKLAAEAEDEGTIDMIGGFLENIEKKSWMLDAWATRTKAPANTMN